MANDDRLPPGEHLGELLSAFLDGEMGDVEAQSARSHLQRCPTCEAERMDIGQARDWLRGLPRLEPPGGFYERVLATVPVDDEPDTATVTPLGARAAKSGRGAGRQWHRWQAGVAAMAACAAATLVVLGVVSPREPSKRPPLGRFIETHEAEVGAGDPVSELATAAVPPGLGR